MAFKPEASQMLALDPVPRGWHRRGWNSRTGDRNKLLVVVSPSRARLRRFTKAAFGFDLSRRRRAVTLLVSDETRASQPELFGDVRYVVVMMTRGGVMDLPVLAHEAVHVAGFVLGHEFKRNRVVFTRLATSFPKCVKHEERIAYIVQHVVDSVAWAYPRQVRKYRAVLTKGA